MICLAVADLNLCKYAVVLIHGEVHDCLVEVLTHGNACNILHCAVVGVVVPKVHAHLIVAFYALVVVYMSVSAGFEHRKIFIHLLDAVGHDDLYSVDLSLFFLLLVYYCDCIAVNNNIDLDILVAVFHDCLGDFGTALVCPFFCVCIFVNRHCVGIGYLITLCINIVYCDILFLYNYLIVENKLILGGILGNLDCLHIVFVVGVKLICSAAVGVVVIYLGSDALALFAVVCAVVGPCSDKALDAVSDLIVVGCYGVIHLLGLGIYFAVSLGNQLAIEEHCVVLFADMSGICGIICLAVADLNLCKYTVVAIHGEIELGAAHPCAAHCDACYVVLCAVVGVVVPEVQAHFIVAFFALVVVYMHPFCAVELIVHLFDAVGHYNLNSIRIVDGRDISAVACMVIHVEVVLLAVLYCGAVHADLVIFVVFIDFVVFVYCASLAKVVLFKLCYGKGCAHIDKFAVLSLIKLDIFIKSVADLCKIMVVAVVKLLDFAVFVVCVVIIVCQSDTVVLTVIVHIDGDIFCFGLRLFCILLCKCYPIVVCAVFIVIVVAVAAIFKNAFKDISVIFGHNDCLTHEAFQLTGVSVYRDMLAVRFACHFDFIADGNLNSAFGFVSVNVYLNL